MHALRAPGTLRSLATADSTSALDAFLLRWSSAAANERANAQLFLAELADLLGVPRPGNDHAHGYSFEFPTGPGATPTASSMPQEPLLRKFRNIECRDAVLAWDGEPVPQRRAAPESGGHRAVDAAGGTSHGSDGALPSTPGEIVTVWDRRSFKTDLVTGRDVPDETQRVPLLTYPGARPAAWPAADFIVGNPPFLGNKRMRDDLGDGYTEALRAAYPDVPESADFVMHWWHKAAALVRSGAARRFGLITTNSLRQTFNRRVVEMHLKGVPLRVMAIPPFPAGASPDAAEAPPHQMGAEFRPAGAPPEEMGATPIASGGAPTAGNSTHAANGGAPAPNGGAQKSAIYSGEHLKAAPLSLLFVIPDHPWVDTAEGAAVRIAMTVGVAGTPRWLRPAFQSREKGAGGREQATQQQMKLPEGSGSRPPAPRSLPAKQPWPKTLAERVAAVERALQSAAAPVTAAALASRFTRAKPADLAEILDTLATMGRAHREGDRFSS